MVTPATTEQVEASTTDSIETIQKLKDNFRVVVDKLNEVCRVNTIMLQKIQQLSEDHDNLTKQQDEIYEDLYYQKIEITALNQYGRRENVEFAGIPESISQDKLQAHIIAVMKSMDINISGKDIHALHRIGKKTSRPRNVIVRFVNRKTAFTTLKSKKKLNSGKYKHYFVSENLCPYNKKIFNACYRYKKNKELHSVWSYNGNLFVKVRDGDNRVQVEHLEDIQDLFSEDEDEESAEEGEKDKKDEHPGENDIPPADHPDNARKDHDVSTYNDFPANSFSSDDSVKSSRRSSRRSSSYFLARRNLSMVEEADSEAESSILRTPIPPLVIHI